ncbi:MAG: hypothetical protein V3W28_04755 [Thermoplasmata archaeon]
MRRERAWRAAGLILLVAALTAFAASSGIFTRDLSGGFSITSTGSIGAQGGWVNEFYAYALTYDIAVFSTVNVHIVIEAAFYDWQVEFESNGSFADTFRPALPGVHRVLITNLEDSPGQMSMSLLQKADVPPDLETSMLNPLLNAAGILLAASLAAFVLARRLTRREGEG